MRSSIVTFAMILIWAAAAIAQSSATKASSNVPVPPVLGGATSAARPELSLHIFPITGKIVMDDGTVPSEPVSIERVCNGISRNEGYTDHSGNFNLQVGRELGVLQDASLSAADLSTQKSQEMGISERDLWICELRGSLAGTWSDIVPLAGHRYGDNANIGTIVLHRLGKVEGTRVSVSSLKAPKDAKKALEQAQKAIAANKMPEAQASLQKAVEIYPDYAVAWVQLGAIYSMKQQTQDARKAYEKANSIDPNYLEPYFQLTVLAAQDQDWQKVAALTDKALALDAFEYPNAYFYNAMAYFNLHDMDRAEKSARIARRLDTRYRLPRIDYLLGLVLFQKQDFAGAAPQFQQFLNHAPDDPDAPNARAMLAQIEQRSAAASGKPQASPPPQL